MLMLPKNMYSIGTEASCAEADTPPELHSYAILDRALHNGVAHC